MARQRRTRSSPRATLALILAALALVLAVAALVLTALTLRELRQTRAPEPTPTVSQEELDSFWQEQVEAGVVEPESPAPEKPWYGLCAKYSIRSPEDFRATVESDPLLRERFATFDWEKARLVSIPSETLVHVSYRKDGQIAWTRRKLRLRRGEKVITDGAVTVRTYCCNEIVDAPMRPTRVDEPSPAVLQPPQELSAAPIRPARRAAWRTVGGAANVQIPEPTTWLLTATGLAALAGGRRALRRSRRHHDNKA